MNDDIKIDSNKLDSYIVQLREDSKKMQDVFNNIKNNSSKLPDYWQSSTSDSTMADFERLYKEFEVINASNEKYISFLENIVSSDYVTKEETLNIAIDNNI